MSWCEKRPQGFDDPELVGNVNTYLEIKKAFAEKVSYCIQKLDMLPEKMKKKTNKEGDFIEHGIILQENVMEDEESDDEKKNNDSEEEDLINIKKKIKDRVISMHREISHHENLETYTPMIAEQIIILSGPSGVGKTMIVDLLCETFNLEKIEIVFEFMESTKDIFSILKALTERCLSINGKMVMVVIENLESFSKQQLSLIFKMGHKLICPVVFTTNDIYCKKLSIFVNDASIHHFKLYPFSNKDLVKVIIRQTQLNFVPIDIDTIRMICKMSLGDMRRCRIIIWSYILLKNTAENLKSSSIIPEALNAERIFFEQKNSPFVIANALFRPELSCNNKITFLEENEKIKDFVFENYPSLKQVENFEDEMCALQELSDASEFISQADMFSEASVWKRTGEYNSAANMCESSLYVAAATAVQKKNDEDSSYLRMPSSKILNTLNLKNDAEMRDMMLIWENGFTFASKLCKIDIYYYFKWSLFKNVEASEIENLLLNQKNSYVETRKERITELRISRMLKHKNFTDKDNHDGFGNNPDCWDRSLATARLQLFGDHELIQHEKKVNEFKRKQIARNIDFYTKKKFKKDWKRKVPTEENEDEAEKDSDNKSDSSFSDNDKLLRRRYYFMKKTKENMNQKKGKKKQEDDDLSDDPKNILDCGLKKRDKTPLPERRKLPVRKPIPFDPKKQKQLTGFLVKINDDENIVEDNNNLFE